MDLGGLEKDVARSLELSGYSGVVNRHKNCERLVSTMEAHPDTIDALLPLLADLILHEITESHLATSEELILNPISSTIVDRGLSAIVEVKPDELLAVAGPNDSTEGSPYPALIELYEEVFENTSFRRMRSLAFQGISTLSKCCPQLILKGLESEHYVEYSIEQLRVASDPDQMQQYLRILALFAAESPSILADVVDLEELIETIIETDNYRCQAFAFAISKQVELEREFDVVFGYEPIESIEDLLAVPTQCSKNSRPKVMCSIGELGLLGTYDDIIDRTLLSNYETVAELLVETGSSGVGTGLRAIGEVVLNSWHSNESAFTEISKWATDGQNTNRYKNIGELALIFDAEVPDEYLPLVETVRENKPKSDTERKKLSGENTMLGGLGTAIATGDNKNAHCMDPFDIAFEINDRDRSNVTEWVGKTCTSDPSKYLGDCSEYRTARFAVSTREEISKNILNVIGEWAVAVHKNMTTADALAELALEDVDEIGGERDRIKILGRYVLETDKQHDEVHGMLQNFSQTFEPSDSYLWLFLDSQAGLYYLSKYVDEDQTTYLHRKIDDRSKGRVQRGAYRILGELRAGNIETLSETMVPIAESLRASSNKVRETIAIQLGKVTKMGGDHSEVIGNFVEEIVSSSEEARVDKSKAFGIYLAASGELEKHFPELSDEVCVSPSGIEGESTSFAVGELYVALKTESVFNRTQRAMISIFHSDDRIRDYRLLLEHSATRDTRPVVMAALGEAVIASDKLPASTYEDFEQKILRSTEERIPMAMSLGEMISAGYDNLDATFHHMTTRVEEERGIDRYIYAHILGQVACYTEYEIINPKKEITRRLLGLGAEITEPLTVIVGEIIVAKEEHPENIFETTIRQIRDSDSEASQEYAEALGAVISKFPDSLIDSDISSRLSFLSKSQKHRLIGETVAGQWVDHLRETPIFDREEKQQVVLEFMKVGLADPKSYLDQYSRSKESDTQIFELFDADPSLQVLELKTILAAIEQDSSVNLAPLVEIFKTKLREKTVDTLQIRLLIIEILSVLDNR